MALREKLGSQVPERTETRAALGKQGPETTGQSFQGTMVRSITLQSPSIPVKNLFQARTVWLAGLGEGEEEHCHWHKQCYSPLLSSQNYLAGSRKGGVGCSAAKITNALKKEERQCLFSKGQRRGRWQQTEETNDKASVKEDNYGRYRGHAVWMFPSDVTSYFSPFVLFAPDTLAFWCASITPGTFLPQLETLIGTHCTSPIVWSVSLCHTYK